MSSSYSRSPELMQVEDTVLVVVDMQQKLMPVIKHGDRVSWNVRRLLDACSLLHLPIVATEQYPQGLGSTLAELSQLVGDPIEKVTFSCQGEERFRAKLLELAKPKVMLCGIETHVCVQQTCLDLLADGYQTYIAVDAVGARSVGDHDCALRRMESNGATLTTVEAAVFEWCVTSKAETFKKIQNLVKESAPKSNA